MNSPPKFLYSAVKFRMSFYCSRIRACAWMLYLFTKTDYKTIFFPIVSLVRSLYSYVDWLSISYQTVFACVAAPVYSFPHLLHGLVWIWLHQLQCNVSNQFRSGHEDAINRPWRPIPAGLISEINSLYLRWGLPLLCIGLSSIYGRDVMLTSVAMTVTTIVYDELSMAGHWLGKNLCNISGYVTFEIGATKLMGKSDVAAWYHWF